ncbi:Transposable_element Tcb2 transposase [Hexamita inflata]|uniref:Transposable element Tcb2 transposase n=1 Tax=Hexamita inflata TaxID=28002 RepID=A0AA86TK23_9EUKA|nr:Transposable element Tcb2 transposase [Hexamita inflata]CAI9960829.1 Transposable element Tcb2 transposase [Hexamita inflata]
MFTDESMFRETANGIDYIIRRLDERYEKEFIHQCKQAGWQSVMVHGAIFGSDKASLYFQVDKRCIKAVDYIEVIKQQLIPNLVKKYKLIYQCDNASPHSTKITKAEFATWRYIHRIKVQIINQLPVRFFLNSIEMVWATMKRHMRYYKKYTFEEFITHVQEAWDSVSSLTIKKLTASMSEKNQQRQAACGG